MYEFQQVQQAARDALDRIGSVIKNPEIQKIVPGLLAALNDPVSHTQTALTTLLEMAFVHIIDPASLAIIMVGAYPRTFIFVCIDSSLLTFRYAAYFGTRPS